MIKSIMAQAGQHEEAVFFLLAFVALFIGILFWVNRKKAKKKYDYMSKLPLEDD